ncbi:MAG: 1-acyl-sn-glycerol-3-phosphate acyltransferase, partial [Cyclobacteriaceae bacterium]|nr:1-acyl-sn-glycerol-3-phosphate acyltransferase [Cyclobacteriaceae bacterium]
MKNIINLILRDYITFALFYYYSKWKVVGLENIPKTGPVILASNHQNAFLDALMIECSARKKSHFLARASAFNNKIALAFLSYIRMMPIYRIRDGIAAVKKNDEIIEKCIDILIDGKTINLFPEGNHDLKWRIRPLQRGLARIVFGAAVKNNWASDIKIVPAGINYE